MVKMFGKPVRRWELHLIHQTHLDIGFTHTQEEVLELQKGYLYEALDLIDSTKDYPEEAQFRWHPEGMWAIEDFLLNANEEDSLRFVKALRQERIHLDALYVHLLTGLACDEELLELMRPAKAFENNEESIIKELNLIQNKSMDLGGYYLPNEELANKGMRPSEKFNKIIQSINE